MYFFFKKKTFFSSNFLKIIFHETNGIYLKTMKSSFLRQLMKWRNAFEASASPTNGYS
jgi:hypothetical protein